MPNITIDSVVPKGPLYPMLVDFENGYPEENFHITCAVLQDRNRNRQIAMELNEVVYAGKEDNEDLEKTLILARNRKTGKTRLIEMGRATLKPVTKADLDAMEQQQEADLFKLSRNLREKRQVIAPQQKLVVDGVQKQINDLSVSNEKNIERYITMQQQDQASSLGLTSKLPNKYEEWAEEKSDVDMIFREQKQNVIIDGYNALDRFDSSVCSKKDIESHKGIQQQYEISSLDLKRTITIKQQEILPLARLKVDVVKEKIENMTATAAYNSVDSVCKEQDFEGVYLPPINREAMRLEDVYIVEKILTKDEQEKIYLELQDKDYTKDLHPYIHSLVKGKTLSQTQTVLSVYASELVKFKHVTARHLRRNDLILNRHSKTLNDILVNKFTKIVKHRNKHRKNGFSFVRAKPNQSKDRVICEALLSMLILNDYKLQLKPLCNVFKQSLTFIKEKVHLLGASIVNDEEAIVQLKLPLGDPRDEDASEMDLTSLQQCDDSMSETSEKFGSSTQEGQNEINVQTVGEQMDKEDNVTGYHYEQEISAYDENESGSYVALVNSDRTEVEVNPNFAFHQLDISACDKNNSIDESAALELIKLKRWEKLNDDVMENVNSGVTDDQLCLSADENYLDNCKLHIHTQATSADLDSLQKRHKTNTLEQYKKRSKEYKKQTEWRETLNSDFQAIMPYNLNGYVELEHIDISAYNNNGLDDESGIIKGGWKLGSKKKKIEQQKLNVDQQTITVADERVNGSVMDDQLDISYDTDTDSDDLYILPRNRESTEVNIDSLQENNEAKKTETARKVESTNNDKGDDFYLPPINRQATEVEDVYPIEKILSKDEYEKIYSDLQENGYVSDLHPYVKPFVENKTSSKSNSAGCIC